MATGKSAVVVVYVQNLSLCSPVSPPHPSQLVLQLGCLAKTKKEAEQLTISVTFPPCATWENFLGNPEHNKTLFILSGSDLFVS